MGTNCTCLKQAYEEASHGAHIFGATDFMGRILLADFFLSADIHGSWTGLKDCLSRIAVMTCECSTKVDQEFSHQGGQKAGGLHPGRNPVMQSVLIVDITMGEDER